MRVTTYHAWSFVGVCALGMLANGCPNQRSPRSESEVPTRSAGEERGPSGAATSVPADAPWPEAADPSGGRSGQEPSGPTSDVSPWSVPSQALARPTPLDDDESTLEVTTEPLAPEGTRSRPSGAIAALVADEALQVWNFGGRSDPNYVTNRNGFHPGTRVRVDATPRVSRRYLRTKAGQVLADRLTASLRKHGYWPFRGCYESTAREQADPGGKSQVRLRVTSDGSVIQAHLLSSELRHVDIARCLADAARRLRLDRIGLRSIEVDVAIGVWPGDVPLLPLPNVGDGSNANTRLDGLTPPVVAIESEVTACMRLGRQRDKNLWGRLALAFSLDESGHPSQIGESESQFGDSKVVACVTELLAQLTFESVALGRRRLVAAWRLSRLDATRPGGSAPSFPPSLTDSNL